MNFLPKIRPSSKYYGPSLFFRVFLLAGFVLIAVVFIYYTQNVVGQLKHNSARMVDLSIKLLQNELSQESSGTATGLIFDEIIAPTDIPIIITDANENPLFFRNVHGIKSEEVTDDNIDKLRKELAHMFKHNGRFPIKHIDRQTKTETIINYFYHGDPHLIKQLQTMPLIEIGIVAAFLVVAYIGYHNIKRSEQHFIWVGMAKETAHQLGTPISSLLGWLELLKTDFPNNMAEAAQSGSELAEIPAKMEADLERLQKIANRFSQIGSRPDLKSADLNTVIRDTTNYFRERLPYQGKGVSIETKLEPLPNVKINTELIGWVVENLVKNSLEACDPKSGIISVRTYMSADGRHITADFTDNGKGVQPGDFRKIFYPGYTSKKRGWGLGLSLARRIVEQYHGGRIHLKSSEPNKATTMQICLPVGPEETVNDK